MHKFIQSFRFAFRQLRKSPAFALTTVLTLALGIGATTAIFSLINTVLLKPLPFPEQERLAWVNTTSAKGPLVLTYPDYFDYRSLSHSFTGMASYRQDTTTLTGVGDPRHLDVEIVSSNFFSVLGVRPMLGRDFVDEEETAGTHTVMLSHRLWRDAFHSSPDIAGRSITLGGKSYNVAGVMPANFEFPLQDPAPLIWVTLADDAVAGPAGKPPTRQRGSHQLEVIARLKAGVTAEQATAELSVIAKNLAAQYPDTNAKFDGAIVGSALGHIIDDSREALHILFAAVCFVLLIACANVAGLMLVRSSRRGAEMALRTALGASRGEIIRQVIAESIFLSLCGGLLGTMLATLVLKGLQHLLPSNLPRLDQVQIDLHVLAFTFAVSVVAGVLFGVLPAFRMSRLQPSLAMREGTRSVATGRHQNRLHSALVIAETAIGLVLLVGSGLLIRSFIHLLNVDPGFEPKNVLTAQIDLPYVEHARIVQFYSDLLPRLATLPGVQSASAGMSLPFSGLGFTTGVRIEGRAYGPGEMPVAPGNIVLPNFFSTLRIPLLSGRTFAETDTEKSPRVVIINEAFARKYFPNENPIGKNIEPTTNDDKTKGWAQIIGVVGNVKRKLSAEMGPQYYLVLPQAVETSPPLVIRASGKPEELLSAVRQQVSQIDKNVPLFEVRTMADYESKAAATPRFQTILLACFAAIALLLSAIGLYAVLSYMVAQRTVEIGVRMALGAQRTTVLKLILNKGLALSGVGLAIGVLLSIFLARFIQKLLYGVPSLDIPTFASVIVALLAVSVIASSAPALRAARLDPMTTLKEQ